MTAHTDPEDHTMTTPEEHYARGLHLLACAESDGAEGDWARAQVNAAIAHTWAFDATQLEMDPGDPHAHLLKTPDGQLIAIVRTDRVTLCCPYHDRFPTISVSCREARTNRGVLGWAEVYEGGA